MTGAPMPQDSLAGATASGAVAVPEAPVPPEAFPGAPPDYLDVRTGEPRRHWLMWLASGLFWAGAALAVAGLARTMWVSIEHFNESSWLTGALPTYYGAQVRVALAVALFALAVTVAVVSVAAGHYAWRGYRSARVWGIAAAVLSLTMLLVNPIAGASIGALAAGALLLWTPPARRFFATWWEHRHPVVPPPSRGAHVRYGPLPRYR